ncbi:MAG: hypothetical protein COA37_17440 [Hoeflea sp.]|uniref:hypothetical protein n=1 Tax=Hoeflea sp. TaxID=1940281 RepID=UPI000C0DFB5F|nr:hypothetical protein [Hoeflea sp.]PHR19700.1 MAG: hypothetical protein COA37_17440 [Hoeflea sp.]
MTNQLPGTRAPVNAPPHNPKTTRRLLRKLAIWLLILVGLPYLLYKLNFPTYNWGQKTTVTVMTPAGERSGSAVVRVRWADTPDILPDAPTFQSDVRGEATVVDLGKGRYLFALISGAEQRGIAVFGDGRSYWLEQIKTVAASRGETREIPPTHRPLMVTFADINDPASVQRVDPDDLAASFGPGYALSSITLAITGEPVSRGRVEAVLGWLDEYPEPKLGPATGQTTNIPFNRRVAHGDFIRR